MEKLADIERKAERIRCVVLDVDGVLTDGRIILDGGGGEWKFFDVRDGLGISLAGRLGLEVVFLTGRKSEVVSRRAAELSVRQVLQGIDDKAAAMKRLLEQRDLAREEIAFLGDDLPDLPAMNAAGLSGAVADASPEVREAADWVSSRPGGRGAVREFLEYLLRARGLWGRGLQEYGA